MPPSTILHRWRYAYRYPKAETKIRNTSPFLTLQLGGFARRGHYPSTISGIPSPPKKRGSPLKKLQRGSMSKQYICRNIRKKLICMAPVFVWAWRGKGLTLHIRTEKIYPSSYSCCWYYLVFAEQHGTGPGMQSGMQVSSKYINPPPPSSPTLSSCTVLPHDRQHTTHSYRKHSTHQSSQ